MDESYKLVYDGECPFCSRYGDFIKLRQRIEITLVDARQVPELVHELRTRGYDIDHGMILMRGQSIWQGELAVGKLTAMVGPRAVLDRVWLRLFAVGPLRRVGYPVVKAMRLLTLRLMGRTPHVP